MKILGMDTEGKTWKMFMAKLYGLGASVVIVGALFKIQHWPFSGPLLTVGLLTEAVIFFFSAFEPPKEEYDWSLVYPELAGMPVEENDHNSAKQITATQQLDLMLEEAKIGPELLNSLGEGFKNLSESTNKMSSISDASLATNEFVSNMKGASLSVENLSQTYKSASQTIHSSVENLSQTYGTASQTINSSSDNLKQAYQKASNSLSSLNITSEDGKTFSDQLNSVSKNLGAINSIYELQLQKAKGQFESSDKAFSGVNELVESISSSLEDTRKYKDEISRLANNIEALNNVYGNMLTAMNVRAASR